MTEENERIVLLGAVIVAVTVIIGIIVLDVTGNRDVDLESNLLTIVAFFFGGSLTRLTIASTANRTGTAVVNTMNGHLAAAVAAAADQGASSEQESTYQSSVGRTDQ